MSVTKVTDAMRNVTQVDAAKITTGTIPEARITALDATKLTGTIHVDRLSNAPATDLAQLEMNQALLAFKIAAANQLAKFSMVDQVIDEYQDATGVNAGLSTNELAGGATTSKYYEGGTSTTPTITQNSNSDGVDGDYTWYKWTSGSSGSFESSITQNVEILVVAGGGAAGNAGGGAGGYRTDTSYAVSASTAVTSITVGGGGAVGGSNAAIGATGGASIFGTITSAGGGGGGGYGTTYHGAAGGSGGGGNAAGGNPGAGNTPSTSPVQGFAGGAGGTDTATWTGGGGGGGAASVGLAPVPGSPNNASTVDGNDGGAGIANDITGTSLFYAGGGGGGYDTGDNGGGAGGSGVGGTGGASYGAALGNATVPTANRGGGGGGNAIYTKRSAGAAGVVVVRVLTTTSTSGGNLTLVSNQTDSTQGSGAATPTSADIVILIEDGAGSATVNTHVKAYIGQSANATPVYTAAVTLVDEGLWGTGKRIFAARGIDTSALSGTNMNYKIETLVQSEGGRETRIHATSLAWA